MPYISPRAERRLFQAAVYGGALVPITAGAAGSWYGPAFIGVHAGSTDFESHFRYLSGLLLGLGVGFVFSAADIERRIVLFRSLAMIVIVGGLARFLGAALAGLPGAPHRFAMLMELVVVPALLLWLTRIECLPHRTERT